MGGWTARENLGKMAEASRKSLATSRIGVVRDGRIFEHLEPFDIVPSVEEFNETYQHWAKIINDEFTGQTNQTR
jgi:hypothetical protein